MKHLKTFRILLSLVAVGAAYVFWGNSGFSPDVAVVWLRASSQVLIIVSFAFLMAAVPRLLPERRDIVDAALAGIVAFFIVAHSLPLVLRISRGAMGELVTASGMSAGALVFHHLFNMVLIPALLWMALSSVVCRMAEPKRKVNEAAYWFVIILALVGLAFISATGTWTIA